MSFHDLRRGTLLCYQSDLLHQPHGFTTRFGGVSTGHLASMNLGLSRGDDRENVLKKLLDFYGDHAGSLFACDQDTINGTLKGRILPLSPRYNFFTNYRYFQYNTLVQLCDAYRAVGKKEFAAAKRKPVIIHFLGDERPWIRGNHNHYGKWYRKYLAMTPWKDMPTQKGKFWYMQLWWCFNQITRICPEFRLAISRRLGMKVIDDRKKRQGK